MKFGTKMYLGGGGGKEFKLIWSHSKIDVRTISGGTFVAVYPYVCL